MLPLSAAYYVVVAAVGSAGASASVCLLVNTLVAMLQEAVTSSLSSW